MTKSELRTAYSLKRKSLTPHQSAEYNALLVRHISEFLSRHAVQTIHTFLPRIASDETDTWQVIALLRKAFPEIMIVVPFIIAGTREMEHYELQPDTILLENKWKIPEPDPLTSRKVNPEMLDAVLIPLLAFDRRGYRVGYGGGYYDRFLKQCSPATLKIGLSFFEPVEKIDDTDAYDVPMDFCITPEQTYLF